MKTEASGGGPPKVSPAKAKRPAKVPKPPRYSYTYNHSTRLYTMDAASLTGWLMDVEGRSRLEKALAEACDIIENKFGDAQACERAKVFRALLEKP